MRFRLTLIILATLTIGGVAAEKAKFMPVSGVAWTVAPATGGDVTCIGGSPTGVWPPCSSGALAHVRDRSLTYYQVFRAADDTIEPLHTGTRTIVFNANLDADGRGRVWGTWFVSLDGGIGEWTGTYTGAANGWFGSAAAMAVGSGTAGAVEGSQVRLALSYDTFPIDPTTGLPGLETITGYRFEPKMNSTGQKTATLSSIQVPNPLVSGPISSTASPGDASHDYPFLATNIDLAREGYVEEEFFFDGTANRYANIGTLTTATIIDSGHPYRTRMVVRRPASLQHFNGTVVVEWQNVTAGHDYDAVWLALSEHLIRRGYAWVGVSAQRVGVQQPPSGLKFWSPGRYGSLDVTNGGTIANDALQFDIFSQAVQALKHPEGVDPMGGLPVNQVIATGASAGAGRLVMYHNSVHPLAGVVDGFLLVVGGAQLRTDLSVKVFKVLSETDVLGNAVTQSQALLRQPDTDHYRTWEVAGTAHLDYYVKNAVDALVVRDGLTPVALSCTLTPLSRIPFRYVGDAALDHLADWVRYGIEPPTAPAIELVSLAQPSSAARDQFGNALGGIRLSQHDIATATNTGLNYPAATFCRVYGSFAPFDADTLAALYPDHGTYVGLVARKTNENVRQGYLVIEDAMATIGAAARSAIK